MKQLINLIFARIFNPLKAKHPALYGLVIAPLLLWIQTHMFDPEVVAVLQQVAEWATQVLPDAWGPAIVSLITWLPTALIGLTGTHSSEIVQEDRAKRQVERRARKAKQSL